jgi:hypothetical protein
LCAFREFRVDDKVQILTLMPVPVAGVRYPRVMHRPGGDDPGEYEVEPVAQFMAVRTHMIAPIGEHEMMG